MAFAKKDSEKKSWRQQHMVNGHIIGQSMNKSESFKHTGHLINAVTKPHKSSWNCM